MRRCTERWPLLVALCLPPSLACSAGGGEQLDTVDEDGDGGDGDGGDDGPSEPWEPDGDGCVSPPPANYDPTLNYEWDAPTPNATVTATEATGPGSLAEALADAEDGDTIAISPELSGVTIALTEQFVVPRSVTIDASAAPGFTLDGQQTTRVFQVEKGLHTRFVGLRIVNGMAPNEKGGGILVRQADAGNDPDNPKPKGSTEVIGCWLEHNTGFGAGGLFVGWRIDALVRDSVFTGNDATEGSDEDRGKSGGAIATRQNASLRIERSVFRDNRGAKSGAVYNILQPVEVEDSVFIGNEATSGSGAFFTDGGNGAGPSNDPDTGADGIMALRRVRIVDNHGTGDGGAMLIWGYPRDVLVIEHSIIKDNTTEGQKGGGGRLHGLADVVVRGTVVAGNASNQQGGGLWIDGSGDALIENSTFSGNRVSTDAGAGFTYNGGGRLDVESCLFAYNEAGRAAGGFWKKPDVEGMVRNSVFAFNEVGENLGERHIGPRPEDGGGNIDFALTDPDKGRTFEGALFADPRLEPLAEMHGTWLHGLPEDSPAIGHAVDGGPEFDAVGGSRDAMPDAGPFELGASCQ